jgi:hypothetical protein
LPEAIISLPPTVWEYTSEPRAHFLARAVKSLEKQMDQAVAGDQRIEASSAIKLEKFERAAKFQCGGLSVSDLSGIGDERTINANILEVLSLVGLDRRNEPGRPRL